MATNASALPFFDPRFMGRYAGSIIKDPEVALVELVANAWDAYATRVVIEWPDKRAGTPFRIEDNGWGMSAAEFDERWRTFEYDRLDRQGARVHPPPGSAATKERPVYGKNGRGRHAAFLFSAPYLVRTWRDGVESTFRVSQTETNPLAVEVLKSRTGVMGHGTEILATVAEPINMTATEAKAHLSTRFLVDPEFEVFLNGARVTFDDVPTGALRDIPVIIEGAGTARLLILDSEKADRTTRQHGVAWRVRNRLVGDAGWKIEYQRILDGRTSEAKRFTFLIFADFLENAVLPDWRGFDVENPIWQATNTAVQAEIQTFLASLSAADRASTKARVKSGVAVAAAILPPLSRAKVNAFVEKIVDECPGLSEGDLTRVSNVLAKLESAESQYDLLAQLDEMTPGDLDTLHRILKDWSIGMAKVALDAIAKRLKLIGELKVKLADPNADEVQELQPLFERGLWIFGPQFESIEYTSNKGMSTVVKELFGATESASLNRPDFVILPDSSIGFYSIPSFDREYAENGVDSLVIVELKRRGVPIGREEKSQAWKYTKELYARGYLGPGSKVTCFVIGSEIESGENYPSEERDGSVRIEPMLFDVFLIRAERRMLNLYEKLKSAPFLNRDELSEFETNKVEYQAQLAILRGQNSGTLSPSK